MLPSVLYGREAAAGVCVSKHPDVQASRPKAVAIVFRRFLNSRATRRFSSGGVSVEESKMKLFHFASVLMLAGLAACAMPSSGSISASVKNGGLSCFSIHPAPLNSNSSASCNDLCHEQGAVCTGVTSPLMPPQSCENEAQTLVCRCCKAMP
jgi:hypothetical protein